MNYFYGESVAQMAIEQNNLEKAQLIIDYSGLDLDYRGLIFLENCVVYEIQINKESLEKLNKKDDKEILEKLQYDIIQKKILLERKII